MKNNFLLIDMDNYFASCEVIARKIASDAPFIVGGNYTRSVVSSCNEAAKKMGIKAGMPFFQVKEICPSIKFYPPSFFLYEKMGLKIENILLNYTKQIKKISIDEWLLDFSHSNKVYEEKELAEFIKARIFKELGLKSSIGIGNNFFNAKTASYFAKPFGIFVIDEKNFKEVVWKIPIGEMYMIGKQSAKIFQKLDIKNIGELANYKNEKILFNLLGKNAARLISHARNLDESATEFSKNHSISNSSTFLQDKADYDDIIAHLKLQFQTIHKKIIIDDKLTKTIGLLLKTSGSDKSKRYTFDFYTNNSEILWNKLINLFDENWNNQVLRGIGVSFDNLIDRFQNNEVQNLFAKPTKFDTIIKVNRKLGYKAIYYAKK